MLDLIRWAWFLGEGAQRNKGIEGEGKVDFPLWVITV